MNISTAPTAAVVATDWPVSPCSRCLRLWRSAGSGRLGRYSNRTADPNALRQRRLSGIPVRRALIVLGRSGYWSAGGLDALFR